MGPFLSTANVAEVIGVSGFVLYICNYLLLTFRYVGGNTVLYFSLNLAAASAVLVGLTHSFNLASALIQVFWIAISLIGISLRWRSNRTKTAL